MEIRNRRVLASGLTALALAAVVGGIAAAQPSPVDSAATGSSDAAATDAPDDDDEVEEQEPSLDGSVQAPDDESLSEQEEADQLAQLDGLISESEAITAATADGGTADRVELGNENGSVVWEVEVTRADGTVEEVVIDAGNGDVLATEVEDDQDDEENESEDDDNESEENESEEEDDDNDAEGDEAEESAGTEAAEDASNG